MPIFDSSKFTILDLRLGCPPIISGAYIVCSNNILIRRLEKKQIGFENVVNGDALPSLKTGKPILLVDSGDNRHYKFNVYEEALKSFLQGIPFELVLTFPDDPRFTFEQPPKFTDTDDDEILSDIPDYCKYFGIFSEIIPNLFLGGETVAEQKLLEDKGIKNVISAMNAPPLFSDPINQIIIPIDDTINQNISQHFEQTYLYIRDCLEKNKPVLVHCHAGVSRSAAIVISFIMRDRKMKYDDAIAFVRKVRKCVNPNLHFVLELRSFESCLL